MLGLGHQMVWLIVLGLLLGAWGCGGIGAGRTTNAARKTNADSPLRATEMLDNSHKNYKAPVR